jgi:acyl-CoA synthetase (AMP-forming)/AMP-acid ligase II
VNPGRSRAGRPEGASGAAPDAVTGADRSGSREPWSTIPRMVERSAERFGDRDAVVDGARRLSFLDVRAEMGAVARSLVAGGVEVGDRVALWAPNCAAWITAALGVHAAGAWLVPLNTRFTGEEAAHVVATTGARTLLAGDGFLDRDLTGSLRAAAPHLAALDDTVALPLPGASTTPHWPAFLARGDADAGSAAEVERRIATTTADDVSDVIFTSGTTGSPKGVMLRHGASLEGYDLFRQAFGLGEGDRYVIPTPFFHCFGYKAGWMVSLMAGAVAFPMAVFDADALLDLVERERITHVPGPPTAFTALLDHPRRPEVDLSSVEHAIVGATSVPEVLVHRMRDELGIAGVLTAYGLTEDHALVSLTAPDDPADVVATTVGRPLPGVEVRLIDDDGGEVDAGEEGEILVRGPFLMSGYYSDPEATAEVIVDGWLHTGDVGVLDGSGRLHITDRKKDIVIVGGFNVASSEVEGVLVRLDGVEEVAVVSAPDDRLGEVVAAYVVVAPGAVVGPDAVVAFARAHLANYKVPRRVEIVADLPRTATGKVLKHELRARLAVT